jgi:Recombination endonuclease VII
MSAVENLDGVKWCFGCKAYLLLSAFNRDRGHKDGLEHRCRECRNAYRRRLWTKSATREKLLASSQAFRKTEKGQRSRRKSAWKSRYGMTEEEYCKLRRVQGNKCAICKELAVGEWDLCVDHHHSTKKVRGLLCKSCNTGLGMAKENVDILLAMVDYLSVSQVAGQ